jgi:hypothetical protein
MLIGGHPQAPAKGDAPLWTPCGKSINCVNPGKIEQARLLSLTHCCGGGTTKCAIAACEFRAYLSGVVRQVG